MPPSNMLHLLIPFRYNHDPFLPNNFELGLFLATFKNLFFLRSSTKLKPRFWPVKPLKSSLCLTLSVRSSELCKLRGLNTRPTSTPSSTPPSRASVRLFTTPRLELYSPKRQHWTFQTTSPSTMQWTLYRTLFSPPGELTIYHVYKIENPAIRALVFHYVGNTQ